MSSRKAKIIENSSFIARFIEVCNSSQPNDIARLLNISYQAAKNYLQGRLPDTKVLITISEKTDYSVTWLLTGKGDKFINDSIDQDTLLLSDKMRAIVRQTCLEVISEVLGNQDNKSGPKIVVLTSEKIKEEKVLDQPAVLSENTGK